MARYLGYLSDKMSDLLQAINTCRTDILSVDSLVR
jgi:hypothetical protein